MRKACACYLALFRIRRKESDSRDMVNAMHDAPFSKRHPLSTSTLRGRGIFSKADRVIKFNEGVRLNLPTRGVGLHIDSIYSKTVDVLHGRPLM